jgi:hypothetical protein
MAAPRANVVGWRPARWNDGRVHQSFQRSARRETTALPSHCGPPRPGGHLIERLVTGYELDSHSLTLRLGSLVIVLGEDAWREAADYLAAADWQRLRPIVKAHFDRGRREQGRI